MSQIEQWKIKTPFNPVYLIKMEWIFFKLSEIQLYYRMEAKK